MSNAQKIRVNGCEFAVRFRKGWGAEFGWNPNILTFGTGMPEGRFVADFIHEIGEMACDVLNFRWQISDAHSMSSSSYLFVLTHEQFDEIASIIGLAIHHDLPKIRKAWREAKRRFNP